MKCLIMLESGLSWIYVLWTLPGDMFLILYFEKRKRVLISFVHLRERYTDPHSLCEIYIFRNQLTSDDPMIGLSAV